MKDADILELAVNSIRYRNLRSWLAILGIVIGVASIISLISISTGLNEQIQKQLSGLGANIISISSGGGQAARGGFGPPGGGESTPKPLTFKDADALRHIQGVDKVDARLSHNEVVTYMNKNASLSVVGTEPEAFPQSANANVLLGRSLRPSDANVAVIGYNIMNTTFNANLLEKTLKINGEQFKVVGILNSSGTSFGGPDRTVFIPQKSAKILFNQTENVSSIIVLASSGSVPDTVAAQITTVLQRLHRVSASKKDFSVITASSLQSTASSVVNSLGLFLGAIASISLLVGGIGVANAMFTSVLEQTKYIGILKSLGARKIEIIKLFLFEACLVGLVGGILGLILSFAASSILSDFGLPTKITPDLLFLGMVFSIVIGAISGVVPAFNAASVEPVEALRYE